MLIVKKLIDIFAKYLLAIGKSLQKLISFHIRYFGGYLLAKAHHQSR
jgi:hypothetical protein